MDQLIRALTSPNPRERQRAADETTDVHRGLSDERVSQLVRVLVSARLEETDPACQEAQLNALCDLTAWHNVDRDLLRPISGLKAHDLTIEQGGGGHLSELLREDV